MGPKRSRAVLTIPVACPLLPEHVAWAPWATAPWATDVMRPPVGVTTLRPPRLVTELLRKPLYCCSKAPPVLARLQ